MLTNSPSGFYDLYKRMRLSLERLHWNFTSREISDPPEVLIISPGGVASTLFIKYVSGFLTVNCATDTDRVKHLLRRPTNVKKVILITGDSSEIISSLSRRGYLGVHSAKMGSPVGVLLRGGLQRLYFKTLVSRQRRYFERDPQATLVINYDDLWGACKKVANFIGVDELDFCKTFPSRVKRRNLSPS